MTAALIICNSPSTVSTACCMLGTNPCIWRVISLVVSKIIRPIRSVLLTRKYHTAAVSSRVNVALMRAIGPHAHSPS